MGIIAETVEFEHAEERTEMLMLNYTEMNDALRHIVCDYVITRTLQFSLPCMYWQTVGEDWKLWKMLYMYVFAYVFKA